MVPNAKIKSGIATARMTPQRNPINTFSFVDILPLLLEKLSRNSTGATGTQARHFISNLLQSPYAAADACRHAAVETAAGLRWRLRILPSLGRALAKSHR